MRTAERIKYSLAGAATGLINGLFGGGGGMIAVPALLLLGKDVKKAHATAIAVILPVSVVSAAVYLFNGYFPAATGLPVAAGVVIGGAAGAFALGKMKAIWVRIFFAAACAAAGIRSLFFV